jgi:hypothetical protein
MPNWCNNTVEIAHENPTKLKALVKAINKGQFCNYALPIPQELKDTVAGRVGGDEEYAQKLLDFKRTLNIETFGHPDWYDYAVANWGTKWDVDPYEKIELSKDQTNITFGFDSAWSPPIGVYEKLEQMGYSVRAYYYEPGMAFCGVWDEGYDDYFEIGSLSWEDVKDEIPEALDEMFGISECMREYAEENDEIDLDGGLSATNE